MKKILTFAFVAFSTLAFGIAPTEVAQNIGKNVTVEYEGGLNYSFSPGYGWIWLGGQHPNHVCTVFINMKKWSTLDIRDFTHAGAVEKITVQGEAVMGKDGKPEILVTKRNQITLGAEK